MTLSGSMSKTIDNGYRLRLTWSATQSVSNNTSTITTKLYWESISSYYTVSASQSNPSGIEHDGSAWHTENATAALSANQSKEINSWTFTVTHASDGTYTLSLDGYFDIACTLSGTYYGNTYIGSQSWQLDTIPRKSSLTSSASWTAGDNLAVSIDRASTSFTHTVNIFVENSSGTYVQVASRTGIATSTTVSFSVDENTSIFQQLAQAGSRSSRIDLITYDGSDNIGTNSYYGTCSNQKVSVPYCPNFNIGDDPIVTITEYNSGFTHDIQLGFGNYRNTTVGGVGTSLTINYDSSQMYAQIPNNNSGVGAIYCTTYYNGVQVGAQNSCSFTAYVVNSNPVFSASDCSYADVNSTTTGITGNSQYIIQNESSLTAYVNTAATAQNSASITKYIVSVSGKSGTISGTTGNVNIGSVTASTNQTMTIQAIDSRGNSTSVSVNVTVIPYSPPNLTITVQRANGFDASTTLSVTGTYSRLTVNGVDKNSISKLTYTYKVSTASTYGTATAMTYTASSGSISVTSVNLTLDNTQAWDFQLVCTDILSTDTQYASVGTGQPLFFIDVTKKSVSVNQFPVNNNAFEVTGELVVTGDATITNNLTINNELIIAKNGYTSTIYFPPQTNDPGYIIHYEDNNQSYLKFQVSDDAVDTDYFTWGTAPSGTYNEAMKLGGAGTLTVTNTVNSKGFWIKNGAGGATDNGMFYGGDTAGLSSENDVAIRTWNGFSVSPSISGQSVAQYKPAFSVNARTGDTYAAGMFIASHMSICSVYMSANQTIPTSAYTKIAFDTVAYDDLGEFDTANHKFVAKYAGTYLVSGISIVSSTSTNQNYVFTCYYNGARWQDFGQPAYMSGNWNSGGGSFLIKLNAGDYLELYADTGSSGTSSFTLQGGSDHCKWSIVRLK